MLQKYIGFLTAIPDFSYFSTSLIFTAVTGYPTVRLYRQHHTSHDIEERSPATIIHQLELLLREDTEPQPQPVTEDLDMREVPLGDNTEDGEDRELVDEERNSDFIYFYDDDNEFPHDEL